MKNIPCKKHTVKLKAKQPDFIAYLIRLFMGALPIICYIIIEKTLAILKEIGIALSMPNYFFLVVCMIFIINSILVWFTSPISFSQNQRIKNLFRKIIEVNKFYHENLELNKIILSMEMKFYWNDQKLYIEVYSNGGQYTNQLNKLTPIFQTALNMTVIAVQDDFADHTTYILAKEISLPINATNNWG